ncbi:hypothetical protein NJC40_09910 [Pseudomonas sp. 21LCFQ02]|uniref:hypothetical protein n=1 Tax=Pseudomonas sp. 21LCFQ02 TaxID=2957505 RepID=UPI00209B73F9|nr:hypothetical protein [Pseudomonas sp. 21LCFQ02]MCO8168090.1 hypothetical protein [Pseudomonas sp. 21LCFQ02]
MSPEMTIVMLIAAWLAVACAMLWGVMRIARRHHQPLRQPPQVRPAALPSQPLAKHKSQPAAAH